MAKTSVGHDPIKHQWSIGFVLTAPDQQGHSWKHGRISRYSWKNNENCF